MFSSSVHSDPSVLSSMLAKPVGSCAALPLTETQLIEAARRMRDSGGSFAGAIADAYGAADSTNRATLLSAFGPLFARFAPAAVVQAVHEFDTTADAYDACQCDEYITMGDILLIASERVVGIAATWPMAVTPNAGALHTIDSNLSDAEFCSTSSCDEFTLAQLTAARAYAAAWMASN